MVVSARTLASILLAAVVVLVVPAARARADGPMCTPDAPDQAPKPPGPAKIEWRDVFWGDRYGQALHAEKPFQNGRLLEGEALYLALDRPDLAAAYRKRQETKTGLGIASGIFLAGAAIAVVLANAEHQNGGVPVGPLVGLGICVTLTGSFAIANATIPADVVGADELRRLVDAHDRAP